MEPSIAQESSSQVTEEKQAPARKPRRWLRILKRVVLSLIIILLILVYGVFPYWVAVRLTNAGTRSSDLAQTETPADYEAEFREVQFTTSDGVMINGWFLPSRERAATIIYSHGLFRSRRELLERAIELWRLGYGALLYDSRNHGASGEARVSMGYHERLDAEAAVKFLREELRNGDRIILFGISMGAAAALFAAAETPEVAAVISDSAYLSFKDTAAHHVRAFLHLPAFPLANIMGGFIEHRADFDASKLDAVDAVKRIGDRPAMFIAAAHDKRMPPQIAEKLHETSLSLKRDLLIVDGPESEIHGHAYQANPQLYISRVAQFLDSVLRD